MRSALLLLVLSVIMFWGCEQSTTIQNESKDLPSIVIGDGCIDGSEDQALLDFMAQVTEAVGQELNTFYVDGDTFDCKIKDCYYFNENDWKAFLSCFDGLVAQLQKSKEISGTQKSALTKLTKNNGKGKKK